MKQMWTNVPEVCLYVGQTGKKEAMLTLVKLNELKCHAHF